MIRFKSIISRIVILHVVAVVITSILMSLALSWLLSYATNNIHDKAMQEQAVSVGEHLSARPDGSLELNLPLDLLGLYSQAYGRYSYAVIDDRGRVLFSSLKDHAALFPADTRTGDVEFLQQRRGDATVSGASVRKTVGGKTVWIQAGEDLGQPRRADRRYRRRFLQECRLDYAADPAGAADRRHRDLPPRPAAAAGGLGDRQRHRTDAHRPSPADRGDSARGAPAGVGGQPGAGPARRRLPDSARLHRRCRARIAHATEHSANPPRYSARPANRPGLAAGRRRHGAHHQSVARHRRTRRVRGRSRRKRPICSPLPPRSRSLSRRWRWRRARTSPCSARPNRSGSRATRKC